MVGARERGLDLIEPETQAVGLGESFVPPGEREEALLVQAAEVAGVEAPAGDAALRSPSS
jgi:hypothetical protein